jgi:23S rRNA (uridine2552-2'-O)-methyltransferase
MPTRWYKEKKREHFYKQAKKEGYRARSAYKLKQIQNKFRVIKSSNIVIDLGAAPGGWSQVAKEIVGEKGMVIGIDLLPIQSLKNVSFIQGDMTDDTSINEIKNLMDNKKADTVLSDMSPDISGNYSVDQARSIYLSEQALKTCNELLKPGGNFVCKVFMGEDFQDFFQKLKDKFQSVKQFSPNASRKTSSEIYIIAKSFK